MTTIVDCIQRAIDAKELNPAHGKEAQGHFNRLVARYEKIMPRHQAEASAAADLKEATRKAARSRFHAVVNQLQAFRTIKHQIEASPDPAAAVKALLEYNENSGFKGQNVKFLQEALNQQTAANLRQMLDAHHVGITGNVTERAGFEALIDELHGDSTGDAAAKALAEVVAKEQNRLRRLANSLGMDIGELANYGIAHSHDAAQVYGAGFDKWAAYIEQRGAWDRIIDKSTGRPFATEKGIVPPREVTDRFLRGMFKNITLGGVQDIEPSGLAAGKALYNRRADHREFHFASGKAWREYNAQFGTSDPFSALLNGLHGLNRDIALMKVLGPNPKAGMEFAAQTAKLIAGKKGNLKAVKAAEKAGHRAKDMLRYLDGSANVIGDHQAGAMMRGARQFMSSAYLGSAMLSSSTDLVTVSVGAHIMGLKPHNVLGRLVKLSANPAEREVATSAGFIADTLMDAGGGSSRFMGQMLGSGLPERLSNVTMRASGLAFWTDMLKTSIKMEFGAELARNAHLPFDRINDGIRTIFNRRGITAADWELLRAPDTIYRHEKSGAALITPQAWRTRQNGLGADAADDLMLRLSMAVQEKISILIPAHSLEMQSRMLMGTSAGTIPGEVVRGMTQFRGYPLSLMIGQYRQFAALKNIKTAAAYAAVTFAGMTMMGALSIQLKETAKGNDPRPMNTFKFWKAATFQGGGLGIFGDFFASEESRTGQGVAATAMGPQASLAGDLLGFVASNVNAASEGRDTHFGRDFTTLVRKNTPVLSSLWYVRAAYDRIVGDTIQEFLDPDAKADFQKKIKKQMKDWGNAPYYRRGDLVPSRAPDLSNILGGGQ